MQLESWLRMQDGHLSKLELPVRGFGLLAANEILAILFPPTIVLLVRLLFDPTMDGKSGVSFQFGRNCSSCYYLVGYFLTFLG